MKSLLLSGLAAAAVLLGGAGAADYAESMATAEAAFRSGDWPALAVALDDAQEARPYSLFVYRNRILARWLAGDKEEALALATKAAEQGLAFGFTGHPAFDEMKAAPEFAAIAARMEANMAPVGAAAATATYPETELLPEAISAGKKAIYIGSVRKGSILRTDKDAEELTLIATAPGGVFDIEQRGGELWTVVNNQLAYEDSDPEDAFAAIQIYAAATGDLLRDVRIGEPGAMLGDLEVAKDKTAYASDSVTPRIYRLAPDSEKAEIFAEDARFANVQGIALDEKHHRLFAADYLTGLFTVDTQTGTVTALANEADAHLGGIDGLYYYKGALIGIQNGATPQRILRISLNDDATAVTEVAVLQSNLDGWNEPTHGDMSGRVFVYIATSNWPAYEDETWQVREGAELAPLRIMTLPMQSK